MKVALIGVGQAGGKVAQAVAEFDREMGFGAVRTAFAVNTAEADLQALDLDTVLIGQDRVNGHGVGGDNELGAEIMQAEATEILEELDGRVSTETEAIVVVAGLGGGLAAAGRRRWPRSCGPSTICRCTSSESSLDAGRGHSTRQTPAGR